MLPGNHYGRFAEIRGSFGGTRLCVAGILVGNKKKLQLAIILSPLVVRLAINSDKELDHNICCVHYHPRGCRVLTLTVPKFFSAANLTRRVCFSMACTARSVRPFHLLSARCVQPPCVSFGSPNWVTANSEGLSQKLWTYHQLHQDTALHHHHDLALTLI